MALEAGDPTRLGPFELVDRLGEGGQGIVYLGRGPTGEAVAVKLLHHRLVQDPEARHRFLREVALAQRVARFCTAPVLHADLVGDRPYVVSEFVPGPSLRQLVERDGPRRGAALDRIAISTATALAAIHRAGITHRDFKPANVLMGPEGPVVIDFGVARALDSPQATATGTTIGTPSYLAPELLSGGTATPAADMFAWGVTMAFAATGRPAFGADTIPSVITRILTAEPDLGELTGLLRELVAACLSKDPALRPSADEVVARLTGNPTGPMPAPTGQAVPPAPAGPIPQAHPVPQAHVPQASPMPQAGAAPARSGSPARRRRPPLLLPLALAAVTAVTAAGTVTVISLSGNAGSTRGVSSASTSAPTGPGDAPGDGAPGSGDGEEIGPVPSPSRPISSSPRSGRANRASPRVRRTPVPTLSSRPSRTAVPARATSAAPPPKASKAPSRNPFPPPSRPPSPAPSPKPSAKPSPKPSPKPSAKPSPTSAPKPNPYTAQGICGGDFKVINSHSYAGGAATTYLLYSASKGQNCVVTLSKYVVPERIQMSAVLQVQGGGSAADSGAYTVYAGPLKLAAARKCVIWGGGYGSATWRSTWSHCG